MISNHEPIEFYRPKSKPHKKSSADFWSGLLCGIFLSSPFWILAFVVVMAIRERF